MAECWYSKEDVLRGLQEMSPGRRWPDIDENGLVYADRQPPRPLARDNEQTELELLYGRDMLALGDAVQQAAQAPDCRGITQMLRMVQNDEHSSDDDLHGISSPGKKIVLSKPSHSCNKVTNKKLTRSSELDCTGPTEDLVDGTNIKGKIGSNSEEKTAIQSKLNPNVKEFVPKFLQNTLPSTLSDINNSSKTNSCISLSSASVKSNKISKIHDSDCLQAAADTKIHKEEMHKNEKKEAALLIKSQISNKNDTLEQQQKTNVAIVKLLKLYAKPKPQNPIKLLTPEYFEKSIEKGPKNEVKSSDDKKYERKHTDHIPTVTGVERMASLHDVVEDQENAFSCTDFINQDSHSHGELNQHNINEEVIESTELTPNLADCDIQDTTPMAETLQEVEQVDPYMKESIDKVNNWFNDKPVATMTTVTKERSALSPILNASAVTYKRKDSSTCRSPCEVTKKVPKPSIADYKPSSYAQELHKKYSERNKASSPVPMPNIWEKLEADLKKKDAEIMNRKKKA